MAESATHPGTPAMMGALGLNTVPDARVDPVGTARIHVSRLAPYTNASFGLQVARPLYVNIRQTGESKSLTGTSDRLFPGIDMKALILSETGRRPAVALGLQSAIGNDRRAGEYLAVSKRFNAFDLTGGLGWGRMGGRGHIPNPLRALGGHFGKHRESDGDGSNGPADWFTGRDIGAFGGVAWDSPLPGLTLKADWNADDFRHDPGLKTPKPWALGFSYSLRPFVTLGAALSGHDIYGSLSFQGSLADWPGRASRRESSSRPFPAYRAGLAQPASIDLDAGKDGRYLESAMADDHTASTRLFMVPGESLPAQLSDILPAMAAHGGAATDAFEIQPAMLGLSGPSIRLVRRDLEQAFALHSGSPQEIWRHAQFGPPRPDSAFPDNRSLLQQPGFFGLLLDTKISLAEDDQGLLYRTSIVGGYKRMLTRHLLAGQSLRLNLADNLANLRRTRPFTLLPVRSDEDLFAMRRIAVDRSYLSWMRSFGRSWHASVTGGYLEEMYGGIGGEILYRPFGRTYAVGAEAWEALKRTPFEDFNLGYSGDHLLTGHLKAWYEVPGTDMTLQVKAGRYLAEDVGGTLSLSNRFRNGASVEAFVTATNKRDESVFGGKTNLYSGLQLRLPFGNAPLVPSGSEARFTIAPIGRDTGQAVDTPLPLYELTDAMSYRRMASDWADIEPPIKKARQ